MDIAIALVFLVVLLGGVLIYVAKEFDLNKLECTLIATGGIALAILSFWW